MIRHQTEVKSKKELASLRAPLFLSRVQAGFPTSVDDSIELSLDLNQYVIKNPSSTFFIKVEGDSMVGAGIFSGDILVVDRSLEPKHNNIVIATVYEELTVKRLNLSGNRAFLVAENPDHKPIEITEGMNSSIWGVVTNSVRKF